MIRTLISTLLLGAVATLPAMAGMVTLDTIVLSGDPAPGTMAGVNFAGFTGVPAINRAGQTAFRASLNGTGVDNTNRVGIFSGPAGSLGPVVRGGDPAPDAADGVTYRSLGAPLINGAGQTAFLADLTGLGLGVFSESAGMPGSPGLVARSGNAPPGTVPDRDYNSFSTPVFNDAGQTAFRTNVTFTVRGAVFSEAAGTLGLPGLVVANGDPVPGTPDGTNFRSFSSPVLNRAGQTAFSALLTGARVDSTNDIGIFSEAAGAIGSPGLVAREGDPAPGTDVNYSFLGPPVLNGAGQTAFRTSLISAGSVVPDGSGIFSEAAGTIGSPGLVAREGDPAPGTSAIYSSFDSPVLNGAGETAFRAGLTGTGVDSTNDTGIFSEAAGSVGSPGLVAREGDPAPGTSDGVNFSSFRLFRDSISLALNGTGQIAFRASLSGTGVNFSNDSGIWATDPNGQLTLVIREGDIIDVDNDPVLQDRRTVRTLSNLNHTGNEDGRPSSFNDRGELAFYAFFTDGSSGLFVATISGQSTVVPEPTTLWMLTIMVLGLTFAGRRQRVS